jgi:hypothetical protein
METFGPLLPCWPTASWTLGAGPEGDPINLAVREPPLIAGASISFTVVLGLTGKEGRVVVNSETGISLGSTVFWLTRPEAISTGCRPRFTTVPLTEIGGAFRGIASSLSFGAASTGCATPDAISIAWGPSLTVSGVELSTDASVEGSSCTCMSLGAISTSVGSETMNFARTLCSALHRNAPLVLGAASELAFEWLSSFGSSGT